jgi:hypothetical protein
VVDLFEKSQGSVVRECWWYRETHRYYDMSMGRRESIRRCHRERQSQSTRINAGWLLPSMRFGHKIERLCRRNTE